MITFLLKLKTFYKIILLIIFIPILIAINFLISTYILYGTSTTKIHPLNIKTPLVLNYNLSPKERSLSIDKFINIFDIDLNKTNLPQSNPLLVDINWIMKANPYPPLLGEYAPQYPTPYYISFGYISTSDEYKQITYYWGEADTTPSYFINKVRGRKTYYGDYYITYAIYLSKRITQKSIPKIPKINHIEWASDSSEMFKEFIFILFVTAIQFLLLIWFLFIKKKKKTF